jgi:hypothetical protein
MEGMTWGWCGSTFILPCLPFHLFSLDFSLHCAQLFPDDHLKGKHNALRVRHWQIQDINNVSMLKQLLEVKMPPIPKAPRLKRTNFEGEVDPELLG